MNMMSLQTRQHRHTCEEQPYTAQQSAAVHSCNVAFTSSARASLTAAASSPSFSSSLRAAAGASGVSFTSGGYRKYRMAGAVSRQMSPGTSPASAHCPQLMVDPSESRARLTCVSTCKALTHPCS